MPPLGNQRPPPRGDFLSLRYPKDLSYSKAAALYSQLFFSRSETCHLRFEVCIHFHFLPGHKLYLDCLLDTLCWQSLLYSPHLLEASWSSRSSVEYQEGTLSWLLIWPMTALSASGLLLFWRFLILKSAQKDRINHTWKSHLYGSANDHTKTWLKSVSHTWRQPGLQLVLGKWRQLAFS